MPLRRESAGSRRSRSARGPARDGKLPPPARGGEAARSMPLWMTEIRSPGCRRRRPPGSTPTPRSGDQAQRELQPEEGIPPGGERGAAGGDRGRVAAQRAPRCRARPHAAYGSGRCPALERAGRRARRRLRRTRRARVLADVEAPVGARSGRPGGTAAAAVPALRQPLREEQILDLAAAMSRCSHAAPSGHPALPLNEGGIAPPCVTLEPQLPELRVFVEHRVERQERDGQPHTPSRTRATA